jgi:hypothetical protein
MSNVEKIVGDIMGRLKPLVTEAVKRADSDARGELLAQFNKALGGAKNGTKTEAAPVKRGPGRPRKNPAPEAAAASADKPKKKAKVKRVMSEETRKKLAENLKKARAARQASQKVKPAKKRGPGRPRKSENEAPAATAEQA